MDNQAAEASKVFPFGPNALSGYVRESHDHVLHSLILDWIKTIQIAVLSVGAAQILAENIAAISNLAPVLQKRMNRALRLSVCIQEMLRIGWYGELVVSLMQGRERIHGKGKYLVTFFQQLIQKVLILLVLRNADTENHYTEAVDE